MKNKDKKRLNNEKKMKWSEVPQMTGKRMRNKEDRMISKELKKTNKEWKMKNKELL